MSPKVLIVCLGNICRSPMGEAVLRHIAKERNIDLTVDSAGTAAYHLGEEPDDRSVYPLPRVLPAIDRPDALSIIPQYYRRV